MSRRFVALSAKRLQAFLSRPLGELDLRVVCIDGRVFREHCMVVALGIDTQGCKAPLGGERAGGGRTALPAGTGYRDLPYLVGAWTRWPRPDDALADVA